MRTERVLLGRLSVNGEEIPSSYADVFIVVREGEAMPGPNDWEVTVQVTDGVSVDPGKHLLQLEGLDGSTLSGQALLRLTDGQRLLFRGDGHLSGFDPAP